MSRLNDILKSLRPEKANRLRVIALCVFAATTFWLLNALNENYSTTLNYPLTFIYDKERYVAVEELPDNIQVNVSGLGWNLFRNSLGIKVTPLRIVLEAPTEVKKISGAGLPALISDQMDEVELNYVLTDTLYINIDERIKRTFALHVDSVGIELDKDYRIVSPIRISPDSVVLEGPGRILGKMSDTLLISIPQSGIDENYKEDVPINTPSNGLIKRNPPTVNVVFNVEEFLEVTEEVPLKLENFPEDSENSIDPEVVTVKYSVAQSRQDDATADNFEIIVDYTRMNRGDSSIVPEIRTYPKFIKDLKMDSVKINVLFNER